jgi:hypothetical protein
MYILFCFFFSLVVDLAKIGVCYAIKCLLTHTPPLSSIKKPVAGLVLPALKIFLKKVLQKVLLGVILKGKKWIEIFLKAKREKVEVKRGKSRCYLQVIDTES